MLLAWRLPTHGRCDILTTQGRDEARAGGPGSSHPALLLWAGRSQVIRVRILALPLKLCDPVPQFPHVENRLDKSSHTTGLLHGFGEGRERRRVPHTRQRPSRLLLSILILIASHICSADLRVTLLRALWGWGRLSPKPSQIQPASGRG